MAPKKITAPTNISIKNLLNGLNNGTYSKLTESSAFQALGFEHMVCDISAAEFNIHNRYNLQTVTIPKNKRGNQGKYREQKVEIVVTTISRSGPQINFWIRKSK